MSATAVEPHLRHVIYDKVEVMIFEEAGSLFTEEEAKHLLGWTEPDDGDSFSEFHLRDILGRTIFLSNKGLQRPLYKSVYMNLMWEILAGNWKFNLETVTVGATGYVLNGQHRLIALVLACQERRRNPERYPYWKSDPAIPILIAVGAEETAEVANTIDTGKPRTLSDSIFATGIFNEPGDLKDARKLCRMAEHSTRMLWTRLGQCNLAYNAKMSHTDALEFLERHPKLLDCIRTIQRENVNGRIDSFSGAYAPALLYLMMTANTDPYRYRKADYPNEGLLDFDCQEKADRYWYLLANRDISTVAVVDEIGRLTAQGSLKVPERAAVIVKGWLAYLDKGYVTREDVEINIEITPNGNRKLLDDPTCGGADLGFCAPE